MKKLFTAGALLSLSAVGAYAATWTGVVSDSHCGAMHSKLTSDDAACIQKCAKNGESAVLVVGDKVYKIDNQDALKSHLAEKVTVTGTMKGDTIHVDSVK
jgi:hypothetical protein